jgi:hypothetical protein
MVRVDPSLRDVFGQHLRGPQTGTLVTSGYAPARGDSLRCVFHEREDANLKD